MMFVKKTPTVCKLLRPYQCGAITLEHSRYRMLTLWYQGFMKTFFGKPFTKLNLLATDTDSFILSVSFEDRQKSFWKEIIKMAEFLDVSNYSRNHPLYVLNPSEAERIWAMMQGSNKDKIGLLKGN